MKVGGEPPKGLEEMRFIAQDTATPYTVIHDGAAANQTAHYILRWALRGGAFGPLSETVSATVVG
jgi:hypothetical protein